MRRYTNVRPLPTSPFTTTFGTIPDPLLIKQPCWDRPGIMADRNYAVQSKLTIAACLVPRVFGSTQWGLVVCAIHHFLWPKTRRRSCESRRWSTAWSALTCSTPMSLWICGGCTRPLQLRLKRAPGKTSRHHALNDLVSHAFASAGIPATKEPHGLTRSDGERSDGLTLVPWQRGKPLSWDVTVICPLADSYVELAAQEAGSAAELTATRKLAKYSALGAQ